jgi:hypothetical protein
VSFRLRYSTALDVVVDVDTDDEDQAHEVSSVIVEAYAQTLQPFGDHRIVAVDATFDGIGAYGVEEVQP